MEQSKIDRINALAKKAKEGELTPEELEERDKLRREYIDSFKVSLRAQLESITVVEEDGSQHKLNKKTDK